MVQFPKCWLIILKDDPRLGECRPPSIARFDRAFFVRLADWAAVAVAIALPWSTSVVGIAIAAWLVVLPNLGRGCGQARPWHRRRRLAGRSMVPGPRWDVVGRRQLA